MKRRNKAKVKEARKVTKKVTNRIKVLKQDDPPDFFQKLAAAYNTAIKTERELDKDYVGPKTLEVKSKTTTKPDPKMDMTYENDDDHLLETLCDLFDRYDDNGQETRDTESTTSGDEKAA